MLAGCLERVNHRRRRIHLEALADLFAGERVAGRVRGRVGGDDLDLVAAVGNQRGVEAVGLVGDLVLEQPPDGFAVSAQIERSRSGRRRRRRAPPSAR